MARRRRFYHGPEVEPKIANKKFTNTNFETYPNSLTKHIMLDRLVDYFRAPPSLRAIDLGRNNGPLAILGQLIVTVSEWEVEVFNFVLELLQLDIIMHPTKGQL